MFKKTNFYWIVFGIVGFILLMSVGCMSPLAHTARNYMPLGMQQYPPKPEGVNIPILEEPPKRPYHIIGKFAFETEAGVNFVYQALQYNGRKSGADAVIMRSLTSRRREWIESKGPWTEMQTKAALITKCDGTTTSGLVNYPVYHPGYTTQREVTLVSVQAEMIVY